MADVITSPRRSASPFVLQNTATATGNGTALALRPTGADQPHYGLIVIQLEESSWTGTLSFEGTVDDTNFFAVGGHRLDTEALVTSIASSTDHPCIRFDVSGLSQFRARMSAYTTGAVSVRGHGQAF